MKVNSYAKMNPYVYPFYIVLHPIVGFQELRYNKKGSLGLSLGILVLWFLSVIYARQKTDFVFNPNKVAELNIYSILLTTVFLFGVTVVSNIAFSSLMDGKGTLKEIWIAGTYSLLPSIFIMIICTIFSNVLVLEEGVFIEYLRYIGYIWSFSIIIAAIQVLHDYSFGEAIKICLLTLLGVIIILFLIMLTYSLFQQVYGFLSTLFFEIRYKIYG